MQCHKKKYLVRLFTITYVFLIFPNIFFLISVFFQTRPQQRGKPPQLLLRTTLNSISTCSVLRQPQRVNPALPICRVPVASASQHTGFTAKRWLCQKGQRPSVSHLQQVSDYEDSHTHIHIDIQYMSEVFRETA